jgi:hypothetical protein
MTLHKAAACYLAMLALTVGAAAAATEHPGAGISVDEAKSLVAQIAEVATEFGRNSSCAIEALSPASEVACHFYMLHAFCAPGKGSPGLSRDFSVNIVNGDVEPIDRRGNPRITEPAVLRAQQGILAAHGVTEQAAVTARNVSREGCMGK